MSALLRVVRSNVEEAMHRILANVEENAVGELVPIKVTRRKNTLVLTLKSAIGRHELEVPFHPPLLRADELELDVASDLAVAIDHLFERLNRAELRSRPKGYPADPDAWHAVVVWHGGKVSAERITTRAVDALVALGARRTNRPGTKGFGVALLERSTNHCVIGVLGSDGAFDDAMAQHLVASAGVECLALDTRDGSESLVRHGGAHLAPDRWKHWRYPHRPLELIHLSPPRRAPGASAAIAKLSTTLHSATGLALPFSLRKARELVSDPIRAARDEHPGHLLLRQPRSTTYLVGVMLEAPDGSPAYGLIRVENKVSVEVTPVTEAAWSLESLASLYCPSETHPRFAQRRRAREAQVAAEAPTPPGPVLAPSLHELQSALDEGKASKIGALLVRQRDSEVARLPAWPKGLLTPTPSSSLSRTLDRLECLWRVGNKREARDGLAKLKVSGELQLLLDFVNPTVWIYPRPGYLPDFALALIEAHGETFEPGVAELRRAQALAVLGDEKLLPALEVLVALGVPSILSWHEEMTDSVKRMEKGSLRKAASALLKSR